ncbi:glucose-6-phosphate 1-dehydrogenase [Halocaridina rubra]|uniref:Glucose-6-phosphate 1-dehydrogenase n=1 Tax=Halocaridina rubra TaxID=373956 RepID=A0AAN8WRJ7_HALRR
MVQLDDTCHVFVVFGASGDLAKKKIYPTLWWLYKDNLLPMNLVIVGYARSDLSVTKIKEKCAPFVKVTDAEQDAYEHFWSINHYFKGSYDNGEDFQLFKSKAGFLEHSYGESSLLSSSSPVCLRYRDLKY